MFVQIYAAFFTIVWLGMAYFKHGQPVENPQDYYDFRRTFSSFVLYLPLVGRVFNWW
jgi:hypothetical protein